MFGCDTCHTDKWGSKSVTLQASTSKQKQLNNSQFTAKEEPERYSSQSDCEINTTEQTFSSFCIQIKGQDLNGNEGTWEKARLLAMRIMILTAKLVSDSDISLLRWIAGCQVFSWDVTALFCFHEC